MMRNNRHLNGIIRINITPNPLTDEKVIALSCYLHTFSAAALAFSSLSKYRDTKLIHRECQKSIASFSPVTIF
jgi:hypothetical protein